MGENVVENQELELIKNKVAIIEQKIEGIEQVLAAIKSSTANPQAGAIVIGKKLSVKEFLLSKKISGDVERTLVIGYYLEKYLGYSSFNIAEIKKGFQDAKEPLPKNLSDQIQKNIAKGRIMSASEEKNDLKAFIITSTGEKFVENDLQIN